MGEKNLVIHSELRHWKQLTSARRRFGWEEHRVATSIVSHSELDSVLLYTTAIKYDEYNSFLHWKEVLIYLAFISCSVHIYVMGYLSFLYNPKY